MLAILRTFLNFIPRKMNHP